MEEAKKTPEGKGVGGPKGSAEFLQNPEEITEWVSIAIIEKDGKFLIGERDKEAYRGKWGFPGGKLKDDETPVRGLERELDEELGVQVVEAQPLLEWDCKLPDGKFFHLIAFRCKIVGDPKPKVHRKLRLASVDEMLEYDLIQGNVELLIALKSIALAGKKALKS